MNTFRNTILAIGLATLLACDGKRDDALATAPPPEQPPAIAAVLEAVEGETVVTWPQFQELAQWYRKLRKWPPADSKLLLYIKKRDDKLADAILLYRNNGLEASDESAFIQYLTSTPPTSVPMSQLHPDAEKWAQDYADRLSVAWPPERGPFGMPYLPDKDLQSLRSSLILINRARYGWDEVIPASIFAFTDDEKYEKQNAMWMAEMAALAYHDEDVARKQLGFWGYAVDSSFRWIDHEDSGTQGFAVRNGSRMVLSFRGTKGFADIATDLLIKRDRVPWTAGDVHRGFSQALEAVWTDVKAAVDEGRGNRKLFITGHSLGAALAQLAAIRLQDHGDAATAVYAFGSPLIGNDDFAKAYDLALARRTFPHINHLDAVTRIPPRWLGFTPVATDSTWSFVDSGHTMARLKDARANAPEGGRTELTIDIDDPAKESVIRSWFADAEDDLRVANQFIEFPPHLLEAGSYDQSFESGRVDDHGINQYLFKLGCAILEEKWKEETVKAMAD